MDFNFVEDLVLKVRENNEAAKEELVNQFRPFIINLSKKTFIHGYDFNDIQSECYITLFNCVEKYNTNSHKFVGYATNGIKNGINCLIRKALNNKPTHGSDALTFSSDLGDCLATDDDMLQALVDNCDSEEIRVAFDQLSSEEKELLDFIVIKGQSIRLYSYWKNLCYSTAVNRKALTLAKLRNLVA